MRNKLNLEGETIIDWELSIIKRTARILNKSENEGNNRIFQDSKLRTEPGFFLQEHV